MHRASLKISQYLLLKRRSAATQEAITSAIISQDQSRISLSLKLLCSMNPYQNDKITIATRSYKIPFKTFSIDGKIMIMLHYLDGIADPGIKHVYPSLCTYNQHKMAYNIT